MTSFNYNPELFWDKVDKSGECWNWTASTNRTGYGQFNVIADGKNTIVEAHRLSYIDNVGPIGQGLWVDHKCHNTRCVRPAHLRAVSPKQNAENRSGAQVNNHSSGVRGVTWVGRLSKWQAGVQHNRRRIHVGVFGTVAEAEAAVIAKRNELFSHNDMDRMAV